MKRIFLALLFATLASVGVQAQPVGIIVGSTPVIGGSSGNCLVATSGVLQSFPCASGAGLATVTGTLTPGNIALQTSSGIIDSQYQLVTSFNANSLLGNSGASPSATVSQLALPSCTPANGIYLGWVAGTGFQCSAASTNYQVIKNSSVSASLTSLGTGEQVITTYTIPAGLMGANGCVRITSTWSWTNNANTKTLIIRYGTPAQVATGVGTALFSTTQTTGQNGMDSRLICNVNSAASQRAVKSAFGVFATPSGTSTTYGTNGIDTNALGLGIGMDVNSVNAGDVISIDSVVIEFIPGV